MLELQKTIILAVPVSLLQKLHQLQAGLGLPAFMASGCSDFGKLSMFV